MKRMTTLGKPGTTDGLCRQFAALYGRPHGVTLNDARAMVRAVFALIRANVEQAGSVRIKGVGTFYLKRMKARRVRWEYEGEVGWHEVPPTTSLGFRAAKAQKRRAR